MIPCLCRGTKEAEARAALCSMSIPELSGDWKKLSVTATGGQAIKCGTCRPVWQKLAQETIQKLTPG